MSEPTPDQIRIRLAELLGWSAAYDCWGIPPRLIMPIGTPGPESLPLAVLPDPASDLNAMAAVEATLAVSGLGIEYTDAVRSLVVGRDECGSGADLNLLTAPAAVRALAAYRVLAAHDAPSRP